MKKWCAKHKSEIVVSVVSSLVVAFLLEAGKIVALFAPTAGHSVWNAVVDSVYKTAADQSSVSLTGNSFLMIISCSFGLLSGFLCSVFRTVYERETADKFKILVDQAKKNEKQLDPNNLIVKRFDRIKIHREARNTTKSVKAMGVLMWIFGVFILSCSVIWFFFPLKLWHNFQLDLVQVAPYISDHEIKELNSEWVSMKGKSDYELICDTILKIKTDNGLR